MNLSELPIVMQIAPFWHTATLPRCESAFFLPRALSLDMNMERATQVIVWAVVLAVATLAYWAYLRTLPMD